MSNTTLWGDPEPVFPRPTPPLSPKAARRLKLRERYPDSMPTDVIAWLSDNRPETFKELMDLRKTLYSRIGRGLYYITKRGSTKLGEEKFVLNGPNSAVLILSNKCRHCLLRTLCRLRRKNHWPPIVYR